MASFNQVVLVGNITRDIEVRYVQSGTAVSTVGLAVNDRVKKGNEWTEETTFVDLTAWGRTAEVLAEYAHKGSCILVSGRLKADSWQDKNTGDKRTKLGVVIDKMQLMDPPKGDAKPAAKAKPKPSATSQPEFTKPSDIPF